MWPPILVLTFGSVTIGTELFGVAGILTPIADDFGASVAGAGQLVTVSAIAYAVGSPVLVTATRSLPRRGLLVGGMPAYAVAAALAALMPDLLGLAIARIAAAAISAMGGAVAGWPWCKAACRSPALGVPLCIALVR
jgi:predicted MFS family arabinose efflux permease